MTDGAITFDFHNTLVRCDSWFRLETRDLVASFVTWQATARGEQADAGIVQAAHDAYRQLRREIVEHGEEKTAEQCVALVLDRLHCSASSAEIAWGVEDLMRQTLPAAEPLPGVVETLHTLRAANVTMGIVSSAVYHPFLLWSLERFGIDRVFAVVTTSASAGYYKSRPEIFEQTLSELGARPEQSVHVGDSFRFDIATPRRIGMRTVWVDQASQSSPDHSPPDLTLGSLVDAAPLLIDLLGGAQCSAAAPRG
jgi:putative hydrolase of the HAD superfamily